ncbi:MAG: bifunctional riboflavin kinase/FAD synthetase [Opitutaceae bacterium]
MNFPTSVDSFEELAALRGELHLAIGVFDGVHLGHKAVIESAVFSARRSGGISGVLTFDPHPSRLFRPDAPTLLMMGIDTKIEMLHAVGVDVVIRKHFDAAFASIPAEDFLAELKAALPALKAIYIGQNFRFGKKRAGDVSTLIQSGKVLGLNVFSVERIQHNGEPISSTRIRKELEDGAIEAANDLLGYNYTTAGEIVGGAKLGRQIGFPTLNLPWSPECLPRFGVYYVRYREAGKSTWQSGVANYGVKPTVSEGDQSPNLEVHALEDCDLSAGDSLEVEWLRFIRPEQKFDSVDALKEQITKDCETARALAQ